MWLYRLARRCFRNRWAVLASWLMVAIAVIAVALASGGKTTNAFSIPGTESQQATSVLETKLPAAAGATTQVVFAASGDISRAADQAAIAKAVRQLAALPQVTAVTSPFQSGTVSADKRVALATVYYDTVAGSVRASTIDGLDPAVAAARHAGLEVEFSGAVYPQAAAAASPEATGLLVALIVLVFTFGSLLAGGIPILAALTGVIVAMTAIMALASVITVTSAATSVGAMVGISCGIDYALFVLSRHRLLLLAGYKAPEAVGRAAGTAGSSVVFAALSVMIGLCGLSVVGIPFLTVMGLVTAGAVLVGLLIAMTLLPAALGFAGSRLARFSRLPGLRRPGRSVRTSVDHPERLAGYRWASWVVRRRVPVLIIGSLVLGALALPALKMDLGLPGASSRPTSDTSRRAFDITTAHFGAGYNGPLTVVAEDVTRLADAVQVAAALGNVRGVATSTVSIVTHGTALITVVPTTGPNDPATAALVNRIRDDRARIEAGTGVHVLIGGTTATDIDVSAKLGSALPVFLAVVAGLALLLLTFAFGTLLVPLKSIIGFLLSAGAALGAEVAVFQWGWLGRLLGVTPSQTLSFLPIILIAVLFGLSGDYEVFVVSRIKEHFTATGDARRAVISGTGESARVVTAAALIMAAVFASFMLTTDPIIKSVGFTFALGVLIDAFVVRLTLVPAAMAIAGGKVWYHPRWYERHVPVPDIEGERLEKVLRHAGQHGRHERAWT